MGVAFLVAESTTASPSLASTYSRLSDAEVNFLLSSVPRTPDGAISHRPTNEPVQLWADYVYMVPPFLAYWAVARGNVSVLQEAYDQCRLYRKYLRDPNGSGIWRHIQLGDWQDDGLWGTGRYLFFKRSQGVMVLTSSRNHFEGNGWAAAGMTRVLATIQHSQYSSKFTAQMDDLASWINEILLSTFPLVSVGRSPFLLQTRFFS